MKVKKVKIGIRSIEESLEDAKRTMRLIEEGKGVKKEIGVYFTSFEAFRKALTPKRLELLHVIKARNPKSIKELAEITKRDMKNVSEDVKYLEQIGLVEKKDQEKDIKPVINYDKLALEIGI
ncbi:MAG: MarR family transcriptional regulator [Deltaproteobacteria bacterium]|nr:MarR family transcriptional regulator [Deltaproteobacteria bacterium]